jgi:hypothetical protein
MKSLKQVPKFNAGVRKGLKVLAFYERFEHLVALALTFIISVIVVVALFRLTWDVFELIVAEKP